MRRFDRMVRGIAIIALGTAVLLGVTELGARLLEGRRLRAERARRGYATDTRELVVYYRAQAWGQAYWKEFAASDVQRYRPFTHWRRASYRGRHVTIDSLGVRRIPNDECALDAQKIFVFGGSAIWGTGAPDSSTIPALLRSELERRHRRPVCVTNFGESGWVLSQSVAQLLVSLRSGQVPDYAVFYDGVNDVYAAYQSGRAGGHQNLTSIALRFEGTPPRSRTAAFVDRFRRYSAAGRMVINSKQDTIAPQTYRTLGVHAESLAIAIVAEARANQMIVRSLGEAYGFESAFFLQPVIAEGSKVLVEEEVPMRQGMDPALVDLFRLTYTRWRGAAVTVPPVALTNAFDAIAAPIWIDWTHISPEGNQIVAREMARVLRIAGR